MFFTSEVMIIYHLFYRLFTIVEARGEVEVDAHVESSRVGFPKKETTMPFKEKKVSFYTDPPKGLEKLESYGYYSRMSSSRAIPKPRLVVSTHTHATSGHPIHEES